jgi:nitrogen fixation protein NifU and related proteins
MSDTLYSLAVLRLAAEANGAGRLADPDTSYSEHNPACGDRSTVDLHVQVGRVAAIAQDTRACVFAQASASILAANLPGHDRRELEHLREDVVRMLSGNGAPPEGPFARYADLKDVAAVPGRHRCVLLPIEAALHAWAALETAEPSRERTEP